VKKVEWKAAPWADVKAVLRVAVRAARSVENLAENLAALKVDQMVVMKVVHSAGRSVASMVDS
jgi:hypothetical protein